MLKVLTRNVLVPSITPKTKRQFLNTYALTQVAKLYFTDARDAAHEFLMRIFSEPEHGFRATVADGTARGGIGGTGNSGGVLQFLVSLVSPNTSAPAEKGRQEAGTHSKRLCWGWQRANEHEQPRQLLLAVLEGCPQMQGPYLANFPFMLEPNDALRW